MTACKYCIGGGCNNCVPPQAEERVAELRRILPPIHRNRLDLSGFSSRVTIDCEWDSEKTGELRMIGVGNHDVIVQLWWQELDESQRFLAYIEISRLIRRVPVVYHNADADLRKLREHGFPITVEEHRQLDDTMLAHAVLHCEEEHTLEYLSAERGKLPPFKDLRGVPGAEDVYNGCDLVETLFVWQALEPELAADPAAYRVYREERIDMLPHVIHEEERGIRVNQGLAYPLRDKFEQRRQQGLKLAYSYCGWAINVGAPGQLKDRVYGVEGFPVQYAKAAPGDVGNATLDKDALATLRRMVFTEWDPEEEPTLEQAMANIDAGGNPVLEARYLYFGAQQALSHYVDPVFLWDGDNIAGIRERVHPECRMHVQTSGRHSYVKPDDPRRSGMAMQQLKGELEHIVHPDPGTAWIGHDWSNIETWLLGALANDSVILEAKEKGWDTHTLNFCDITGMPYPPILTKKLHTAPCTCPTPAWHLDDFRERPTMTCPAAWRERLKWQGEDDIRRVFAKRFVYRLHYRGQAENAGDIPGARALGFDAKRLVIASENYLARHEPIVRFWREIEQQVDKYGVVYAFMGMPRRLTSPYKNARYREGCNHPMQAGVAHIYNRTRLLIHQALPWLEFMFGKHDSQWWQCPEHLVEQTKPIYEAIVQREFIVNGQPIRFPGSFKERRPE